MVSCQPSFQSYKIALKNCDQSVIEHNLVTIYLNLEWPDNISDNPNLLIHIFDKKYAPKFSKTDLPSVPSLPSTLEQYSSTPSLYRPSSTNGTLLTADQNDVTSTTTVLYNISPKGGIPPLKIPPPPPPPHPYRHQSSPACSSSNQGYFNVEGENQISPTVKSISPISSQNHSMTHVIDIRQTSTTTTNNASSSSSSHSHCSSASSSSFKAFLCSDLKTPLNPNEQTCPTSATILSRPLTDHRSLAQRAAVASQIRSNRSISMTSIKEQGQTATNTIFPLTTNPVITSQTSANALPGKKSLTPQRSVSSVNNRIRKRRVTKQISLPNNPNHSLYPLKEEQTSPLNTVIKSPGKLFSPFSVHSMQTTVTNSEIDQTIEEVINGKGEIVVHDHYATAVPPPPLPPPPAPVPAPVPPQPSSQLVWVQNGAVTTKTWLSPLYQKQSTPVFDPPTSTLTHQDVVNIAQQVVFPSVNERTSLNKVVPLTVPKRRNRSKSSSSTSSPLKRTRQRKAVATGAVRSSTPKESNITPTLNLISKPVLPSSSGNPSDGQTTTTMINVEKNDLWQNVDTMLDDFHLVAIDDQQRIDGTLPNQFDFDLSIDRFPSSTPPPPPPSSSSVMEKSLHPHTNSFHQHFPTHPHQGKLTGADVDVYEHFLNPLPPTSNALWQENQVTSSVSTPPDFPPTTQIPTQPLFTSISEENFHSQLVRSMMEQSSPALCTRCGSSTPLIDITHYEFPDRKGLVFECVSCGNNSLRSNLNDEERQQCFDRMQSEQLSLHLHSKASTTRKN